MESKRFTLRAAVYLILLRDEEVLLLRRANTGWGDGKYSLVAGHMDGNETVKDAMIREAKEEVGITLEKDTLAVVHTMHRISPTNYEYIDFFLVARTWTGEVVNCEQEKCDDLKWANLSDLPENTLPNVQQALASYKSGSSFSEMIFE
jgi:8-oxo-dGTP pyrophosphatase MutT (NUDIX family)